MAYFLVIESLRSSLTCNQLLNCHIPALSLTGDTSRCHANADTAKPGKKVSMELAYSSQS